MAKILYSDYYIPNKLVPAEEILYKSEQFKKAIYNDNLENSIKKYVKATGLQHIAVGDKKDIIDVLSKLMDKMFQSKDFSKEKIKNIFYTSYEEYNYGGNVSVPHYLQEKFKLTEATVVVINQDCSSTIQAIRMASALNSIEGELSLIISPYFLDENEERYIDFTILGDGAGIIVVGDDIKNKGFNIMKTSSISNGRMSVAAFNFEKNKEADDPYYNYLKNKLGTFEAIRRVFSKLIGENEEILKNANKIIIQNIAENFFDTYYKMYKMEKESFYRNYIGGHVGDVDIIRNFKDFTENNSFKIGDEIVLLAIGSDFMGVNCGATLLKYF
jgi:3-oxoacyl-[acyl-carrier-protein] synthase-3